MTWRFLHFFFRSILFTSLLLALGACDSGYNRDDDENGDNGSEVSFEHVGLAGHEVSHLYEFDEQLFAATNQGLYTLDAAGQWQSLGLDGSEVRDIAFLDNGHFIASIDDGTAAPGNNRLVESTDDGDSWQNITHNFGGEQTEAIYGLHYDAYNNALYATGIAALAASYDNGRSWELLNGMWGSFGQPKNVVTHNPATNDIWYGGQNAIEDMVLVRYPLDTQQAQLFSGLLPSPSVIYGIEFSPESAEQVYVSGEGGLLKTRNNGDDWQTLIGDVDHRFYFEIAIDPEDPQTLYTGGWDKGAEEPQPLILEISEDDGETWAEYRPADADLNGGVRSVLARDEDGSTVVYLGLYGQGVVKATIP